MSEKGGGMAEVTHDELARMMVEVYSRAYEAQSLNRRNFLDAVPTKTSRRTSHGRPISKWILNA